MNYLEWFLIIAGLLFLASSIRIVYQFERGVKFTLGKFTNVVQPGLRIIIPYIQSMKKIDIRQKILDLEAQEVMTKDQVNLKIDGVVFYYVKDADKVVLNVENIEEQLGSKATSELKEIIGNKTMSEALQQREQIATALKTQLKGAIEDTGDEEDKKEWGIIVKMVQINNIELPQNLVRAMAKEAEAEREKKAIVIRAEGEAKASKKYAEASKVYAKTGEALRLRELKTYEEIGKEQNTLMIVIPREMGLSDGKWLLPLAKSLQKTEEPKKKKE